VYIRVGLLGEGGVSNIHQSNSIEPFIEHFRQTPNNNLVNSYIKQSHQLQLHIANHHLTSTHHQNQQLSTSPLTKNVRLLPPPTLPRLPKTHPLNPNNLLNTPSLNINRTLLRLPEITHPLRKKPNYLFTINKKDIKYTKEDPPNH
jgi:hypothetical protein